MTPKRRETRAEADERIVAEAGPWKEVPAQDGMRPVVCTLGAADEPDEFAIVCAAARVLNRLRKKGRGK